MPINPIPEQFTDWGGMVETPMPQQQAFATNILFEKIPPSNRMSNHTGKLLQEIVLYKALKLRKTDSIAYEKIHKSKNASYDWVTLRGMVGIEVEVENIHNAVPVKAYWDMKPDNSLRNAGAEFVSIPLAVKQIQTAIEHLFASLVENNKPDFSNRTSIHIHVNCRDMTQDQIWNMCVLYAIFEKHFYKKVGTKRLNSIFCVPLFRTNQLSNLNTVVYDLQTAWHKYCGLNLLPLYNNPTGVGYGTIEFRHLHGTNDQKTILDWIDNILCIRQFAMTISKEELEENLKEMNTTSSYLSMYHTVFPTKHHILTNKKDFEECVSNLKRELYANDFINTIQKGTSSSVYWETANKLGVRG